MLEQCFYGNAQLSNYIIKKVGCYYVIRGVLMTDVIS
jgi:hypothetical protein